jgi:Xaa-Pro aminopeptidase
MQISRIATAFITVLSVCTGMLVPRAAAAQDFESLWEISCIIRNDKFDYVLPNAMRRNDIDMWIVIDHGRGTEPMMRDFGIETAYGQGIYVFYDGGGDRIERYSLGGRSDLAEMCGAYDELEGRRDLRSIVEERDPQRIGLNYLAIPNNRGGMYTADGLSYTDYKFLVKELGEKYAERFVSAQHLIADFHGERVASEIIEFSKIGDITRSEIERALSNEVITPGKTTHNDVARWLEERRETLGLLRTWFPTLYTHLPDGGEIGGTERVIQRGDVLQIDWGINRNNFATDIKRFAYVLREGELEAPPGVLNAFEEAKKVREIIRKNVRPGRTGRVQLDELKQIIRDAGYVYTERERAARDVPGIEVNVGMHAAGNISHDVAAGLFEIYPERTKYEVRPNSILSMEYIVFTPADEWGGAKIPVNIEENVVVTERGIEWLYPPQDRVILIR